MIKVPFSIWIGILLFFVLFFFSWIWWIKSLYHKGESNNGFAYRKKSKDVLKCPYCGAIVEKDEEGPVKCEVCKSYV